MRYRNHSIARERRDDFKELVKGLNFLQGMTIGFCQKPGRHAQITECTVSTDNLDAFFAGTLAQSSLEMASSRWENRGFELMTLLMTRLCPPRNLEAMFHDWVTRTGLPRASNLIFYAHAHHHKLFRGPPRVHNGAVLLSCNTSIGYHLMSARHHILVNEDRSCF